MPTKRSELVSLSAVTFGPDLPYAVIAHCLVLLDEDRVFMLGGGDEYAFYKKTRFYNFKLRKWTAGPNFSEKRFGLSCGIAIDSVTDEKIVIAAGGNYLKSVEIWTEGWQVVEFSPVRT